MNTKWMRSVGLALTFVLAIATTAQGVRADGTETLGAPSIPIGSGTGIVAAGVGLDAAQPAVININVPGTPVQVLLYWECFGFDPGGAGDNQISVNGTPVTGSLIGGPAFFFEAAWAAAHRADITALGLVAAGPNALSVEGLACSRDNDGAGVLVIFDDGSSQASIQVRDGVDLAFINFPAPRQTTVAQTFTFPAATQPRNANLEMFFASVGVAPPLRPSAIDLTVGGTTTTLVNELASLDGGFWDTLGTSVLIPAGATSLTVQAFSRDDLPTGELPASFSWLAAGLSVPVGPAIELVKQVSLTGGDPFFDADNPGDPDVPVGSVTFGSDATYRLIVRNIGSETLINAVINDPTLGLVNVAVPGGPLLPGEQRTIVSGDIGFDALFFPDRCDSPGNKNNVAFVDAQGATSGTPVSDDDPANVNCIEGPAITLLKQVSLTGGPPFFDADNPGDPDVPVGSVASATDATYRLIVRNIGDETLVGAVVSDASLGLVNVPVPGGPLAPGEERVIDAGDFGFGNLFFPNRCDSVGNKNNVAFVDATGQDTGLPVSDDNPANVNCAEACSIEVSKTCLVAVPPSNDLACEAKIAATTLRYIGPDRSNATVVFQGTSGGLATYSGVNLVSGVTILTQVGQNGFTIDSRPGDLGSKMNVTVNGVLEIIHTSCSAVYAAGQPAPLDGGTPNPPNSSKGDPSPNWLVVNFVDKDGKLVAEPGLQQGAAVCDSATAEGTLCKKRPSQISLRYNGGDCSQTMHNQDPSKVSCSGDAGVAEPVRIVVSKPDGSHVSLDTLIANVSIGDIVMADAANFGAGTLDSDSRVLIFNGSGVLLQDIKFHTSCSQPLRIGDKFGSVQVVGFVNSEQGIVQSGANVDYSYKISNTGTTDVNLTSVLDDQLGELLGPFGEFLAAGDMLTLSSTAFIDTDTTNVVNVTGNVVGIPTAQCVATDFAQVNLVVPPKPPGSCADGKPVALEFEYTGQACDPSLDNPQSGKFQCSGNPAGAGPVQIVITKDADKVGATPSTETINVGDLFTIAKNDGRELASETKFDIRQGGLTLQSLSIHTSCSQDLNEGDRFGGVTLRTFVPKP